MPLHYHTLQYIHAGGGGGIAAAINDAVFNLCPSCFIPKPHIVTAISAAPVFVGQCDSVPFRVFEQTAAITNHTN